MIEKELRILTSKDINEEALAVYGIEAQSRQYMEEVVQSHLFLLNEVQIKHLIDLQKWWGTSYGDDDMTAMLDKLEKVGHT